MGLSCVLTCRSDAGCGYNQLVYSSLVGLKQHDHSLFTDSLSAARSASHSAYLSTAGVFLLTSRCLHKFLFIG